MQETNEKISKLMELIGYVFQDTALLQTALTHASKEQIDNYERIEFLGDAVLELIVTEYLYEKYPQYKEGQLTALRTHIVREEYLASWAMKNDIGAYILLGKGEDKSGGREKSSILSDVVESIIGAVYLDGGMEEAKRFVLDVVVKKGIGCLDSDAKTELQIELQKKPGNRLRYQVYNSEGPPHDTTFYVQAVLNGEVISKGEGKSKKQAEQMAAKRALKKIKEEKLLCNKTHGKNTSNK